MRDLIFQQMIKRLKKLWESQLEQLRVNHSKKSSTKHLNVPLNIFLTKLNEKKDNTLLLTFFFSIIYRAYFIIELSRKKPHSRCLYFIAIGIENWRECAAPKTVNCSKFSEILSQSVQ